MAFNAVREAFFEPAAGLTEQSACPILAYVWLRAFQNHININYLAFFIFDWGVFVVKQFPKYVPVILGAFVSIMVVGSWMDGWYTQDGNLSGIWVEMHGIVIELLLLVVIWNWYVSWKEKSEWSSVSGLAHAALYGIIVRLIKILNRDYCDQEKQYLKFGNEGARKCNISMLDIVNQEKAIDEVMIEIRGGYQKVALDIEREAESISHEINRLYVLYHDLLDPEMSFNLSRSINALNEFREDVNLFLMTYEDKPEEIIPDDYDRLIRDKSNTLLTYLVLTKQLIEKAADGTMSKEEMAAEQNQRLSEVRKIRNKSIMKLERLKSRFSI